MDIDYETKMENIRKEKHVEEGWSMAGHNWQGKGLNATGGRRVKWKVREIWKEREGWETAK